MKSGAGKAMRWLVGTLTVLLIIATLIPTIVSNQWWIRIFVFPQAQIAALLLIVALMIPFVFRMRKLAGPVVLAAVLASLTYQLSYLLPYSPLWEKEIADAGECRPADRLSVLVLNVKEGDPANPATLDLVRQVQPDLFLAMETEPEWLDRMSELRAMFSQTVEAPRGGAWGMVLFSRLPLLGPEVRYLVDDYVPSIRTGVRLPSGGEVTFYGLHPKPPLMHDTARGDAELIRAGREIRQDDDTAILAGDLNDVPWSYTTQNFMDISGMADPRVGRAFDATFWPDKPLLRWPLDHAFATDDLTLLRFEPMQDVGSDHYPVLAEFCRSATVG